MFRWLTRRSSAASAQAPQSPPRQPSRFEATATLLNDCGGIYALMPRTVGVSRYQPAVRSIVAAWQADHPGASPGDAEFIAALYPETTNAHDPMAVQVQIDGQVVGYLSREDARAYRPVTAHLARRGEFAACKARIVGGRADAPTFGVWLDLAAPDQALD